MPFAEFAEDETTSRCDQCIVTSLNKISINFKAKFTLGGVGRHLRSR